MDLHIADKTHELNFDFGFIHALDEKYKYEQKGMKMGFGVNMAYTQLDTYHPDALVDVIHAATEKISRKDIEKFIQEYVEENELENLFDDLKDELGKSGLTKAMIKKFKIQMKQGKN